MRDGPSTSTSIVRPTNRCERSARDPLHGLHEALHALALDAVRDLPVERRGLGARAGARR